MPVRVGRSQKIGSIAESEIEKRLKEFSNPMKPAYDLGIDFPCELLVDGSPSSDYFLVQAKGTQRFGERWRGYFGKDTIVSWLNQPSPVYLIVYDLDSGSCYWTSIHRNRKYLIERISSQRKKVPVIVDKSHMLEKEAFVRQIKEDLASIKFSIDLSRGFPRFIGIGYVKKIPRLLLPNWLIHNIGVNIRLSVFTLASHYFYYAGESQKAYFLCRFLTNFDKQHYDHFLLMGRICKSLGRNEEAKSSYREAIAICKRDTRWDEQKEPSDPSIEDIISLIKREMKTLQ